MTQRRTARALLLLALGMATGASSTECPGAAVMQTSQQAIGEVDSTVHPLDTRVAARSGEPARFTPSQSAKLESALAVARRATRDTLFAAVLRRLSANNEIEWGTTRLSAIPRAHRGRPTAFLLGEFGDRGLWRLGDLRAYDYPNDSRTTSAVVACADTAKVNVDKLGRTVREIAGTMTHERAHGFCHRHRHNDRRRDRCDFAYIAGDLTIIIDRFRANGSRPVRVDSRVCGALAKRLREYRITE